MNMLLIIEVKILFLFHDHIGLLMSMSYLTSREALTWQHDITIQHEVIKLTPPPIIFGGGGATSVPQHLGWIL